MKLRKVGHLLDLAAAAGSRDRATGRDTVWGGSQNLCDASEGICFFDLCDGCADTVADHCVLDEDCNPFIRVADSESLVRHVLDP